MSKFKICPGTGDLCKSNREDHTCTGCLVLREFEKIVFFMPMVPPTITAQMHKVNHRTGQFYDPPELKAAKAKLEAHLARHVPESPYTAGVGLVVKWCFPCEGTKHSDGEYRITRPDTDNLQKALKDCMTHLGFWTDDALVCREIVEKFWAKTSGIYICIQPL